jgi:hypothetical protein
VAALTTATCLQKGDRMNPYLEPQAEEFFDRTSVPPEIADL